MLSALHFNDTSQKTLQTVCDQPLPRKPPKPHGRYPGRYLACARSGDSILDTWLVSHQHEMESNPDRLPDFVCTHPGTPKACDTDTEVRQKSKTALVKGQVKRSHRVQKLQAKKVHNAHSNHPRSFHVRPLEAAGKELFQQMTERALIHTGLSER